MNDMTYFPDLSPYKYDGSSNPGTLNVGWLDGVHSFPRGSVDVRLVEKLKLLAAKPVELYFGHHRCELCAKPRGLTKTAFAKWEDQRSGNGEIRVSYEGVTFAAPVLITHYIQEHDYLPPAQFLKAIDEGHSQI